jgi:uncharacterized protein (UPF0276 family)
MERWPALDYLEIISDNFLGTAPAPGRNLERIARHYPLVMHGIGLNLLGHEPLDERYLDALARLADRLDASFFSDHLCWTGAHGARHHDLLPVPYTEDLVDFAASRASYVQRRIGRPFGLENLSSYVALRASEMSEVTFYTRVVREANCFYMLDVNNIFVSSVNHGFGAHDYLAGIDWTRVLQVHLAGHTRLANGTLLDTHDRPICSEVWELYRQAWCLGGPFPTLVEWDAQVPSLPELLQQLERAREVRA